MAPKNPPEGFAFLDWKDSRDYVWKDCIPIGSVDSVITNINSMKGNCKVINVRYEYEPCKHCGKMSLFQSDGEEYCLAPQCKCEEVTE